MDWEWSKATKEQNHSEMLKAMQGGMKRKPKSMYNFNSMPNDSFK